LERNPAFPEDWKYTLFTSTIKKIYPIENELLEKIYSRFDFVELDRNQRFIQQGFLSSSMAFVAEGLFIVSFINEEAREYIKYFLTPPDVLLGNLMENEKSNISIEALEHSKVFRINYSEWNTLTGKHSSLNQMKNALLNKYWNRKEEREMELMGNDAKKNYALFLDKYACLEEHLSQYHIAQYLGITPTQLSRIKKSLV